MHPHTQAISLLQGGESAAALQLLQNHPDASAQQAFLLGACHHALGDLPRAITAFTDALRRDPAHAQAACALGSLYAGLGHLAEARALFRQTLSRIDDAQLRFNLAVVLEDQGESPAALQEYARLLQHFPGHYGARHNRAGLLARLQRTVEAVAEYRQLIDEHPGVLPPRLKLAELELAQGHYDAAIELLEAVLAQTPAHGQALLNLALALAARGDIADSHAVFARLRLADRDCWEAARARINDRWGTDGDIDPRLIFLVRQKEHQMACNWRYWSQYGEHFRDFVGTPGGGDALALPYIGLTAPLSAQEQLQLARHVAGQVANGISPFRHVPTPRNGRLRLGYAAPNLGNHVTAQLLRHFLGAHDPDTVEVFALSLGKPEDSANLHVLRATPGLHWLELSELDDAAAAEKIRELELDVLVDLALYSDTPRPGVLARRPAPVQVGWLGAPYSSGAPWLDYLISDPVVSPGPGWCSEAEVRLPGSYFVFSHDGIPQVPTRASLGLPDNRFVFSCLNSAIKLEPDTFDIWMRILAATPESVLWLLAESTAQVMNLKREAEWRGIDPRRLLLAPRVSPAAHLARQGAADLFLDTRLCNGHTTVAEALWSGTPVLTCPGATFASRVGASLVSACGLPALIAESWESYEATAVMLYRDRERLKQLRAQLAVNRRQAPMFDLGLQARQLEKAFRHMQERFLAGRTPAAFDVALLAD